MMLSAKVDLHVRRDRAEFPDFQLGLAVPLQHDRPTIGEITDFDKIIRPHRLLEHAPPLQLLQPLNPFAYFHMICTPQFQQYLHLTRSSTFTSLQPQFPQAA
jgi:hypothetical protein